MVLNQSGAPCCAADSATFRAHAVDCGAFSGFGGMLDARFAVDGGTPIGPPVSS